MGFVEVLSDVGYDELYDGMLMDVVVGDNTGGQHNPQAMQIVEGGLISATDHGQVPQHEVLGEREVFGALSGSTCENQHHAEQEVDFALAVLFDVDRQKLAEQAPVEEVAHCLAFLVACGTVTGKYRQQVNHGVEPELELTAGRLFLRGCFGSVIGEEVGAVAAKVSKRHPRFQYSREELRVESEDVIGEDDGLTAKLPAGP